MKICDFANMTRRGQKIQGATTPFYRLDISSPASEQFAVASCIFAIFKGDKPFHELDYNKQYKALEKGKFSLIEGMQFGYIISSS